MVPVESVLKLGNTSVYVFRMSDNAFVTQNGYLNFVQFQYADGSGYSLDSQCLVFKVKLPY